MRTRKETSECEVRAALIWTESTGGSGASCTAVEVCWGTTQSRLHTCGDRLHVSFPSQLGAPQLPPQGLHWLTSDGKGGPTSHRWLGMPGVSTVWGGHIDGEGTIVAESLDMSLFAFHFCELAIGPKLATSVAFGWLRGVGHCSQGTGHFGGSGGKGRLP